MAQLPFHQLARVGDERLIVTAEREQLEAVLQRRERIAQLVSQHGQELILAAIGGGQLFGLACEPFFTQAQPLVVLASAALGAIALRRGGTQKQPRDRDHGHEECNLQQAGAEVGCDEGASAGDGRNYGDGHRTKHQGGRGMLTESQRRPDDRRENEVVNRVGHFRAVVDKHREAQEPHGDEQQHAFRDPLQPPAIAGLVGPYKHERRGDQVADGIADPPR